MNAAPQDLIPVRALNQVTYCPRLYYLEYVESVMPTNEYVEDGLFPCVACGGDFRCGSGGCSGGHWTSCRFFASSEDLSCQGTLATMTPGSKWRRVLMRSAVWLCTSCSHHFPTTYSGM